MACGAQSYMDTPVSQLTARNYAMTIPDNTISAFTDDILNVILLAHIEGDLSRTCWVRLTIGHGGSSDKSGEAWNEQRYRRPFTQR